MRGQKTSAGSTNEEPSLLYYGESMTAMGPAVWIFTIR